MSGQKPEWVKKCIGILKSLKAHKHGWVFSEPVDPVKLNIPDYLEIIKKPMDLGTVRTHLDNGTITNPEDFKANVVLTFDNAMRYNPANHDVHMMAKTLKEVQTSFVSKCLPLSHYVQLFFQKWTSSEATIMEKWKIEKAGGDASSAPSEPSIGTMRCIRLQT
eukprot:756479-Hanusia_phi.AAC.4